MSRFLSLFFPAWKGRLHSLLFGFVCRVDTVLLICCRVHFLIVLLLFIGWSVWFILVVLVFISDCPSLHLILLDLQIEIWNLQSGFWLWLVHKWGLIILFCFKFSVVCISWHIFKVFHHFFSHLKGGSFGCSLIPSVLIISLCSTCQSMIGKLVEGSRNRRKKMSLILPKWCGHSYRHHNKFNKVINKNF